MAYNETPTKGMEMNKFHRAKIFVRNHKTELALVTGVALGAAAVHRTREKETSELLEITPEQVRVMVETGASVVYETPLGKLQLKPCFD